MAHHCSQPLLQAVSDQQGRQADSLRSLHDALSAKLLDIKHEEISWIKIFLIYYAGAIGFASYDIVASYDPVANAASSLISTAELTLYIGIGSTSTLIAWLACRTMIELRHSYFGIASHIVRIWLKLRLYQQDDHWGAASPMGTTSWSRFLEPFDNRTEWRDATNPKATFLTRILLILGASIISTVLAMTRVSMHETDSVPLDSISKQKDVQSFFLFLIWLQITMACWMYWVRDYSKISAYTWIKHWKWVTAPSL